MSLVIALELSAAPCSHSFSSFANQRLRKNPVRIAQRVKNARDQPMRVELPIIEQIRAGLKRVNPPAVGSLSQYVGVNGKQVEDAVILRTDPLSLRLRPEPVILDDGRNVVLGDSIDDPVLS